MKWVIGTIIALFGIAVTASFADIQLAKGDVVEAAGMLTVCQSLGYLPSDLPTDYILATDTIGSTRIDAGSWWPWNRIRAKEAASRIFSDLRPADCEVLPAPLPDDP